MWTKRQLIYEAFAELAIASYVFDLDPDELQTALRRLDAMMATWYGKGIHVGYAIPSGPSGSDLDDDSGLPDSAVETLCLNLAIRLAPGFGKTVSPDTKKSARDGYDQLLWVSVYPQQQQLPHTMPRGAGNKTWRTTSDPFFPTPNNDPLQITQGGDLDILSE